MDVPDLSPDPTGELLDRLLGGQPALRTALSELRAASTDAVDGALLALCHDRIAMLIGLAPSAATAPSAPLTARERACIDVAEQSVLDVAAVNDAQVAALVEHLGADGAATFVYAVLVVEQRLRMRAMWLRLGLGEAS